MIAAGETHTKPGIARRALSHFAVAIVFLTILPLRADGGVDRLGAAASWFPIVGALVGGLAGGVRLLAQPLFGPAPATVLAMIALIVVTGALHQDGLADTADGLGVRGNHERRLAAMRDPSTGVFGALAVIAWALLVLTTLQPLTASQALRALIAGAAVGRWAALLHAISVPPARTDGLGAAFRPTPFALAAATVIAAAAAEIACGALAGLAVLASAVVTAGASIGWTRWTFGGRTGDTVGATVALAEVATYLTLLAIWRS